MARYNQNREYVVANHQIKFPEIRVLNDKGEMIGIMQPRKALELAQEEHKDLVLVTKEANPPVAKIIELSKYKYQQQRKEAKARKKNRAQDIKEIRFTMFMGEGDIEIRKKRIKEFLEEGNKVRLSLQFKGRQIAKKEFAYELFGKVISEMEEEELGKIEMEPKINGRKLIAQITPV